MAMPFDRPFRRWLLLAALLLAGMAGSRLPAMSTAGRQDRRQFEAAVKEAFLKEDYATLEATAEESRVKRDRFPEGLWTLSVFYSALELEGLPLGVMREFEARLARWEKAVPGSVAVRIVRSQGLREGPWERVEGGADVSKAARLARAQAGLDAVAEPARGPDWFAERLRVAWRLAVPRGEFDALYERAVALEPTYHPYYFARASYLRMHGGIGEWEAFALEAGRKSLSGEGMGLYSRIVWSQSALYADGVIFRGRGVEWPLMRDGFRDLERAWPGAEWNLNNFCRFACLAGDRGTARELFARIGERWTTNWLSHAAFVNWRDWAMADVDPRSLAPIARLAGTDWGWSVAFAADGLSVFGGFHHGHVRRWDAATGAVRWHGEIGPGGHVHALAVSPDGRTLAAGTSLTRQRGFHGTVALWDLPADGRADPPETAPARRLGEGQHRGGPLSLRWSADGRRLGAAGGSYMDGFGEFWLWAMPEGREVRHVADIPLVLKNLAFLDPAGNRLAQAAGLGFHVFESATGATLFSPEGRMHACAVRALAPSPDGRTLACATAAGFEERDRPGEVAFWDVATWTRRPAPSITHAGGVLALAWSPDGRWLLGGGYDGFLRVWDAATGRTVQSWPPGPGEGQVSAVAWSPDGGRAAAVRLHGAGCVQAFNPPPPGP